MLLQKCGVYRTVPTHQPTQQQETVRRITNPNPNKTETKMFINCRMWTRSELDLWDLIVTVLHGNTHQNDQVRGDPYKSPLMIWAFFSSNVNSSRKEALLYIFEDNEAMIKMIIKGRSATMRHVSRTHRVALDWFNYGPQDSNQIC